MAIKIPVVDRISTYPGRVVLVPVPGEENTYVMTRADQPTEVGTPLNKELLDQKAYTLTKDETLYVSPNGNDASGDGTSEKPYRSINKAISDIPKDLGGYTATIMLTAGSYPEVVSVTHFSNGRILLSGPSAGTNVTINGLNLLNANYAQIFNTVNLTVGSGGIIVDNNSLLITTGLVTVNGGEYGIRVENNANFHNSGTVTINNTTVAAIRAGNGRIRLQGLAGTNNEVGLMSVAGGVIVYGGDNKTLTAKTATNTATGGRIYAGAQTSIPNY